jgi:hypothetical protein
VGVGDGVEVFFVQEKRSTMDNAKRFIAVPLLSNKRCAIDTSAGIWIIVPIEKTKQRH